MKNSLLMRGRDAPPANRARKRLIWRRRTRTCAGFGVLKKVRTTFFNILLKWRHRAAAAPFHVVRGLTSVTHRSSQGAASGPRLRLCLGEENIPRSRVLGGFAFGGRAVAGLMAVALEVLDGPDLEYWLAPKPVVEWHAGHWTLRQGAGLLWGFHERPLAAPGMLYDATRETYEELLRLTAAEGHPQLVRVWHFMPQINDETDGLEHYRAFCKGRHEALATRPRFEASLPAASAIGTRSMTLQVAFLAASRPAEQVENPRQVSAFRYPRCYGPRSPSFSRAVLWRDGSDRGQLFISGTASIVGHATRHRGDPAAQLHESLENMSVVLAEGAGRLRQPPPGLPDLAGLRLYLRHPAHTGVVKDILEARVPGVPRIIVQGDICRRDLELEVEGLWTWPAPA